MRKSNIPYTPWFTAAIRFMVLVVLLVCTGLGPLLVGNFLNDSLELVEVNYFDGECEKKESQEEINLDDFLNSASSSPEDANSKFLISSNFLINWSHPVNSIITPPPEVL